MRRDHRHVGLVEIANMLGVSRQRAHQIRRDHPDFPKPVDGLRMGSVWHAEDIEGWQAEHPERPTGVRRG